MGEPDRSSIMGPRLLHARTQRGPVRSRQDDTGSLRLQNQISGQDLRKAQERTGEVRRSASQVQRNRLRPVFPQPPASLSGITDTSERGNAMTSLFCEKILS